MGDEDDEARQLVMVGSLVDQKHAAVDERLDVHNQLIGDQLSSLRGEEFLAWAREVASDDQLLTIQIHAVVSLGDAFYRWRKRDHEA